MAFAIGFIVLGLACFIIFSAIGAFFGLVLKVTFSFTWFVVVVTIIGILTICKYIVNPFKFFKKKKVLL